MTDVQQSSDMVGRIAAIISRVVYQHEAIEPAAREILEASHHAELVEALQAIARDYENQNLSHRAFRIAAMGHVNVGLAKIGGGA